MHPIKLILWTCCLLFFTSLHADQLANRIKLLLPDDGQNRQTERQFFRNAFNDLVTSLEAEKLNKKSTQRKIDLIRERVEMNFLRNYQYGAGLLDFFRTGTYDDISATLIEALLLEYFGVPYFGFVDHWNTRLLADPAGRKIILAPLASSGEIKQVNRRAFRTEYVELLNLTVLPAQRPTSSAGVDSLFARYHYNPREVLDFDQLAAYWHYQRALRKYAKGDFIEAIRTLGVARNQDERPAFEALEQAIYLQLTNTENEEDSRQTLFYLFELWNKDPDNDYLPNALLTTFVRTTNQLFQAGADFGPGEQLYQFLDSRGQNQPAWRERLREIYYLQKSRYYAAQNRYDQVSIYIDSLYVMRPDHPVYQQVMSDLTFRAMRAENLTGEDLKKRIAHLTARYPFLLKKHEITDVLLEDQARHIRRLYEGDDGYRGDSQLAIFRNQAGQVPANKQRNIWVLTAYVAASNYYFRMGEYTHSRRLLGEALELSPADDYLLHRYEVLQRY